MPKLIRLTTTDENANFESRFNSDIILKPNSKIALQNLSMEVVRSEIVIDSANELIKYSLKTGTEYNAIIPNGDYSASNIDDFLNGVSLALNKGISTFSGKEIGAKYYCRENKDGKIEIGYDISPYDTFKAQSSQVLENAHQAINTARRDGGTPGAYDSYITTDNARPFLKGCTSLRVKNKAITDSSGIIVALCDKPATTIGTPTIANIKHGLQIFKDGSNFKLNYIHNGTPNTYGSTVAGANSFIELALFEGDIHYNHYASSVASATEIHKQAYDYETNLYPYIFFLGADTNTIDYKFTKVSLDNPTTTLSGGFHDPDGTTLEALPTSKANPTDNYFDFGTPTLANFLGFNNTRSATINATDFKLVADNSFQPTDISDSFIVMLDSLNLSSYDAYDNSRKSMLAVIPKSDNNSLGEVIYEPNYPTYIDIDNAYDLNIRGIRARILKNDLTEIITNGLTTLTLLVDN